MAATARIKSVKNVHDGETSVTTIVQNLTHILDQEKELKSLAGESGDSGTEDQMSALIEAQEKTLWMYKAWLK